MPPADGDKSSNPGLGGYFPSSSPFRNGKFRENEIELSMRANALMLLASGLIALLGSARLKSLRQSRPAS
jgi:hypothetical protein